MNTAVEIQPQTETETSTPIFRLTKFERCMILKHVIGGYPVKNFEDASIRQSLYEAVRGDLDWPRTIVKESERDDSAPVVLSTANRRDLAETIKGVLNSGKALGDLSSVILPIYYRLEWTQNEKE